MEIPATRTRRSVSPSLPGLGTPQVGGGQRPAGRQRSLCIWRSVGKMQVEDGFLRT